MLPVEVRIYPTYKIVADLGLLDTLRDQGAAHQPLQAAGRDPEQTLPITHIDDERRPRRLGDGAAAGSGHYAVL
jgi:hypothetical protein